MNTTNTKEATPESWAIGAVGELGSDEAALFEGLGLGRKNMERFNKVVSAGKWIDANARLIASAPELLEALELVFSNAGESPEWIRSRIAPIIAKAKGDQ